MKIFFDNVNWSSSSGPNSFATRLAHQLSLFGHVVADSDDYDVVLTFIESTGSARLRNKPMVHRLDGIWFRDREEFQNKNVNIKKTFDSASSVVFQSSFDKEMVTHWWGAKNSSFVVRNGIETKKPLVISDGIAKLRTQYDKIFVCSANWHPQKRLIENIRLFQHVKNTIASNSCLIILGNHPDVQVANPHVFYTGPLPHHLCLEVFSVSDCMFHLAWLDHCPNTVVEALSVGCPVVCSSSGGTKELVGENGFILQENDAYQFQLTDYDRPPIIDVTKLVALPTFNHASPELNIVNVAKNYEQILRIS